MTEKETMSRGRGPRTGRPAAEGANVDSVLDLAAYLTKAERRKCAAVARTLSFPDQETTS
jgi:hypothetical protein